MKYFFSITTSESQFVLSIFKRAQDIVSNIFDYQKCFGGMLIIVS